MTAIEQNSISFEVMTDVEEDLPSVEQLLSEYRGSADDIVREQLTIGNSDRKLLSINTTTMLILYERRQSLLTNMCKPQALVMFSLDRGFYNV